MPSGAKEKSVTDGRKCSWTVVKDGKAQLNQTGSEFDEVLYGQLKADIENMLCRGNRDVHARFEFFGDGTEIMTITSIAK